MANGDRGGAAVDEAGAAAAVQVGAAELGQVVKVVNLANAIREYGHLAAQLDPLGAPPLDDPSLHLEHYGLHEEELRRLSAELVGGPVAARAASAWDAIQALRTVYSTHTGFDYDHLRNPEERMWLRDVAESGQFRPPHQPIAAPALLERLTQVEAFEHFLQRTFPGKTRFSIEGLDMLVPMLDEIVGIAAENGIYAIPLGMAHRGRLNVMAHILCKSYEEMLLEFKDPLLVDAVTTYSTHGWTGDVKYHAGALHAVADEDGVPLVITIAPNPSHLEHVNPVVEGMARAAGTVSDQAGAPQFDHYSSLPILIHGDAAFSAQGIVAETLNLARIPGYSTGGTIHIIANNQLGFTTAPEDARSTLYASDLAKGFKIPIIHVNADDPVACLEAARIAVAYRNRFHKDFLIDLIGYRRYGHNEGDEPRFTQPLLYAQIDRHPTVRKLWADALVQQGVVAADLPQTLHASPPGRNARDLRQAAPRRCGLWSRTETAAARCGAARAHGHAPRTPARTGRSGVAFARRLYAQPEVAADLCAPPANSRKADERNVDWATAEQLAFASILAEGIPIRITGQDVERGTFSHRHAVLYDAANGQPYIPLQQLSQAKAAFEIHNSPLSENAAMGFEYGYNIQKPERFVLWEAQYGDFINGAQAVIDEFIVSGRAKWEQTPSLVLLLPHGYEGQGPDHSTGRLERFLQMAAETNMRIANCTTAAQYFHLLRRQAALLHTDPLPLVVMTPKSLLRHPQAMSSLTELASGEWQPVIDDAEADPAQVRRLILCSGKVYVDLVTDARRRLSPTIAIARVEQLYPFPQTEVQALLARYAAATEVVWLQEEAQNMGAWEYIRPMLQDELAGKRPLR